MENIRQAIERVKARSEQQKVSGLEMPRQKLGLIPGFVGEDRDWSDEAELDLSYLQSQRVVSYDGRDPRSRPYDVLRTEVLREMDLKGWRILAVTSPTPGCGKTLTAVNLALSIGRQPERQVLLADIDLRKPSVAASLGLKCQEGLLGVVEGRIAIDSAVMRVRAGNSRLEILPTAPTFNASDLVDSSAMTRVLREVAEYRQSRIIIVDLPPLLTGHDVISILPQVDCVLLVAAVGLSRAADIEQCEKHLQGTHLVRFVLNKVPASKEDYAYY